MFTTILMTLALTLGLSFGAPTEEPPLNNAGEQPCMTSSLCQNEQN